MAADQVAVNHRHLVVGLENSVVDCCNRTCELFAAPLCVLGSRLIPIAICLVVTSDSKYIVVLLARDNYGERIRQQNQIAQPPFPAGDVEILWCVVEKYRFLTEG